ncbi:MAG: hypothetical protein IPO41_02865 [Acidobacteria bacterium]|nr:hypothetical protein [Acidobacteriota bacterium]
MSFRGKLWVLMISGVVAVYAVVGGLPLVNGLLSASAQQPVNDATAQLKIVESVLQHIQNDYVDEPNMEKSVSEPFAASRAVSIRTRHI